MSVDTLPVEVTTPASLIAQAIEKGLGVAELEKLMGLQERWEANQARKAFFQAFTDFQASAPDIRKTKEVAFKDTKYKFAPLSEICRQLSDSLKKAELSYRWEITDDEKTLRVTCLVSHIDGHTERTTMQAAPDTTGSKNSIQARGSAIEYLKRYTLIGALGLSTTDTDMDGQQPDAFDMDKLHKDFMEIYNQVIQIDPKKSGWHPDNWKSERTGRNYVRAIGEIRKVLYTLQPKD
jgi:hypothetical protein